MVVSFLFFLCSFLAVGIYSSTQRHPTAEDYLVAGRRVSPWLTALSAVATNNSGFMYIGLIGATYSAGISVMWLMVGWIGGDYVAWRVIHRRLRERSEAVGTNTIPGFLGVSERGAHRGIVVLAAVITLVFLGTYAAAQLTAGSKALHVLFGWDYGVGAVLGAGIVIAYCFAGGIRASIWTDAVQSIVMLAAMFVLLVVGLDHVGGMRGLWNGLRSIDPALVDWRPRNLRFGFALYLCGWMVAGIGVLGQPHIMIRAMAIDSSAHMAKARRVYFLWYVFFSAAAILVGLTCRIILPSVEAFDSELALPLVSQMLLPEVLIGFTLAGLFAATVSTADSQILSCSAALTQDLFPHWGESYRMMKVGTVVVTVAVVTIVFLGKESVFNLVVFAWSALASSLGPLLVLQALAKPITNRLGVAMMLSALAVMLLWRYGLAYSESVYEVLPGMATGFLVYRIAGRQLGRA